MLLTWYGGWVEKLDVFCIVNDVTLQRESVELSFLFWVDAQWSAVDSGKRSGLCVCVSWEMLILGGLSFFPVGCHGNISQTSESAESHATSLTHSQRLCLLTCRQQISVQHALHSWILLVLHRLSCCFFYFYVIVSHWFSPVDVPSRCFHSLLLCFCHAFLMTED